LVFVLLFHLLIRIAEVGKLDWASFQLMLFELPNIITLFFPIAILISGLLALGNMNSRNEITVMRANGFSRLRIGLPLLTISVLSALLMIVMMEFLTPMIIGKLGIKTSQPEPENNYC
jgi:lipopolysaccharide export system permease protein